MPLVASRGGCLDPTHTQQVLTGSLTGVTLACCVGGRREENAAAAAQQTNNPTSTFTMRLLTIAAGAILLLCLLAGRGAGRVPLPTPAQLTYQQQELVALTSFNMATFVAVGWLVAVAVGGHCFSPLPTPQIPN